MTDESQPNPPKIFLSVVIPLRNEVVSLDPLFKELLPALDSIGESYEVICVNDGSEDDTLNQLLTAQKITPVIKIVDLSRNFGKDLALMAGISHATGKTVVVMDADLQDPPELIPKMVELWRQGHEVVYGARRSRDRDTFLKRFTARSFYNLYNLLVDVKIPPDAGDFRLMDQKVVNALESLPERTRFTKGLFSWVGFRQIGIPYDRPVRHAGHSQWSYLQLIRFAFDGLFSFSVFPLRVWTWIGVLISTFALGYSLYFILRTLIYGIDVPGYPSVIVAIMFFGGVQLLSVGILGEYIGRIFSETKKRPLYIIRQTHGFDKESEQIDK